MSEEYIVDDIKRDYLISLLYRTTYDDDTKRYMEYVIGLIDWQHQYEFMLNRLIMNEIKDEDRISMGMNYSQSDIKKTLRNRKK